MNIAAIDWYIILQRMDNIKRTTHTRYHQVTYRKITAMGNTIQKTTSHVQLGDRKD